MRRYSPFKIRKNMAEALILMKIDYSVVILHSIPAYQFKRLQRLQNTLAGFVISKYAGLPDLHRLNWLPVKERMDFATVKLTHKILHKSENCPEYINLTWKNTSQRRSLRSNEKDQFKVEHVKHINTFESQACSTFNELPENIHKTAEYNQFVRLVKNYYFDKAYAHSFNSS